MSTSVKRAVEAAVAYFGDVLPVADPMLEEIELATDEKFWHVTLSGLVPVAKVSRPAVLEGMTLSDVFKPPQRRVYKRFIVRDSDGKVMSMKIRVIEPDEK